MNALLFPAHQTEAVTHSTLIARLSEHKETLDKHTLSKGPS